MSTSFKSASAFRSFWIVTTSKGTFDIRLAAFESFSKYWSISYEIYGDNFSCFRDSRLGLSLANSNFMRGIIVILD